MSKLKYKGKELEDCNQSELIELADAIFSLKESAEAEAKGLRQLLASPFPVHALWKNFAEWAIGTFCVVIFLSLLLKAIK